MIQWRWWYGAALGVVVFSGALSAQSPETVVRTNSRMKLETERLNGQDAVALIPLAVYLKDAAAKMSIADVRGGERDGSLVWTAPSPGRDSLRRDSLGLGHSSAAFWLKIRVAGGAENKSWFLQQSYPLIDRLDVYVYDEPYQARPARVFRSGDHTPFESRPIAHRTFVFPITTSAAFDQTIYIRVRSAGSLRIPLYAWSPEAFYRNEEQEKPLIWMYYGIIVAMLAYNLFVFASVRDPAYAYYVIYLFALAVVTAGVDGNASQYLWPSWPLPGQIFNLAAIYITCGAMAQFSRFFLELPRIMPGLNRALRFLAWTIFALILAGAPLGFWLGAGTPAADQFYRAAVRIGSGVALSFVTLAALSIYVLVRHRVRQAGYFAAAFLLLFIGAVVQILGQFAVLPGTFLTSWGIPIGTAIQVIVLSLGLADRINAMKNGLQNMNERLEIEVVERTRMLQNSLQDLQDLKDKQDGDYFLTSLLIAPLTPNRARGENVGVQTLTEQKKKFQFRHWRRDLGGDLCVAHTLRLRGRSYTVFLNADAMGKSMQGAGGALVIGAAFQSIIDRTQSDPASANKYPEKWLEYTFQHLNSIFDSFNGSMLVSIALGVVDDETGTLYYVNAEHPWTVLYRQGRAAFIEDDAYFRKLGMADPETPFFVRTLQLEPGDVLIAGSDGRDDLVLPGDDGQMMMCEDERLFLKIVEQADGDLEAIRGNLLERGEFSDDLSLIRVAYHPSPRQIGGPEKARDRELALRQARSFARQENWPASIERLLQADAPNGDPSLRRELVRSYSGAKDYQAASKTALAYMESRPHDFDMLVAASRLCKKANQLDTAIDQAERACLRNPQHLPTLILLSELYARTGQYERAAGFLDMAESRAPGDARVQKIRRYLYNSGT